jgi:2'-5' RNA ligase
VAGALIVTAELAQRDFSWIEGLRRAHYPPERNRVPAHLTIFHALPPSAETELRTRLALAARRSPPSATIAGLMDLGSGLAFRVVSPDLDRLREELAADLHGLLGVQDSRGWRPHVTIQNKVAPKVARALMSSLQAEFAPRPLAISGMGLRRYLDGPWDTLAVYPFRGVS